jgi:hypothetical protein
MPKGLITQSHRKSIMFTLKFIAKSINNGNCEGNLTHVISANSYEVYTRNNGIITISVIDSDGSGIDFYIAPERAHNEFEECFVENVKGKTIARYVSPLTVDEFRDLIKPKIGSDKSDTNQ